MVQQINNKGRKMSQQEEMKISLSLGVRRHLTFLNTLHKFWNLLIIVMLIMIILSNLTVQNLRHFVLLLGNQISLASISLIFQTSFVWSLNL